MARVASSGPCRSTPARNGPPSGRVAGLVGADLVAAEAWRTWTDPAEVAWRLPVEIDAAGRDDEAGACSLAPACHLDGRPVRHRAPLQAVPDPQDGGVA